MAQQRERARFKGKARQLQLVDAIFDNCRCIAKVVNAAEMLTARGDDTWPLYAALEQLLHERRAMRTELEQLNREEKRSAESTGTRPAAATA